MNKKLIIIISSIIIVAIAIAVGLFCLLRGNKDSYRIIKIIELDGNATVTRESTGDITPYNNMILESGDTIFLESGNMTIQMDEDKYAYVEENTKFSIKAEGDAENSKTTIEITSGAITNEIQNKLSGESSYEVNAPNSTMAVRGTVFRTAVYYDDSGICYTKVSAFDGKVATRLTYPDGTFSGEETAVEAGKEVVIYQDDQVTDYLSGVTDIDYSALPEGTQKLIESILGYLPTDKKATDEGTTEDTKTYTVTFMCSGSVFGTQTVEAGERATIPSLTPAANGYWDFDFNTKITEDTVIYWK